MLALSIYDVRLEGDKTQYIQTKDNGTAMEQYMLQIIESDFISLF